MPTLIDTREAFRRLQEQGGFTDDQADAIVDIFTDIDEQVATRGDIEQLRSDLEGNIKQLRTDTKSDTDQLRTEMEKLRTDMEAMEDRLTQKMQKNHASTIRTVVASVAAVGAVLAVIIPLAIYLIG